MVDPQLKDNGWAGTVDFECGYVVLVELFR